MMGAAAEHRGNNLIRRQLSAQQRPAALEIMESLNAVEKTPDCGRPFGPLCIRYDAEKSLFFLMDAKHQEAGFSVWYSSLRELMRRWDITITGYDATRDIWSAVPRTPPTVRALWARR